MTCCMCETEATAFTPIIDGEWYAVCADHLSLWRRTPENISLREWCRRITTFRPPYGKTWSADYLDSLAVSQ